MAHLVARQIVDLSIDPSSISERNGEHSGRRLAAAMSSAWFTRESGSLRTAGARALG
ncbi:hypothetical protein [Neorhizobium galegae]|uniref:hypothetical protein n=1 Tax=Neorhizobium galegae TaxID=399 RepID=UPI00155EFC2B|nr:hypothetical protein [Neorhizobium galegae]